MRDGEPLAASTPLKNSSTRSENLSFGRPCRSMNRQASSSSQFRVPAGVYARPRPKRGRCFVCAAIGRISSSEVIVRPNASRRR